MIASLDPHVRFCIHQYAEEHGVTMSTEVASLVLEGLKARGHTLAGIMRAWLEYAEECELEGKENMFPGKVLHDLD